MTELPAGVAPLFTPFRLGPLTLPNRFVMAPMTRGFSPHGVPGRDVAEYYARRAAAGVGLIVTEGVYVDTPSAGGADNIPRLEAATVPAWAEVVRRVQGAGGHIFAQLWHLGAVRDEGAPPFPEAPVLGPSGLALDGSPKGRAMTADEIRETIAGFTRSAVFACEAGFDGVELHGAHGYLIDQFFWDRTNRRTDAWGAGPGFAAEVTAAVCAATGPDFPVMLRFSQWKGGFYDARPWPDAEALRAALRPVAEAGITGFHVSTRRYFEPGFEGSERTLAGHVRDMFGLPVVAVGSVGLGTPYARDPVTVVESAGIGRVPELFADGEFDLIALGRALLHDPRWVEKLRTGARDDWTGYDPASQKRLY